MTAFASGKQDKITDFFTRLAPELHSQSEWKEWFCKFFFVISFDLTTELHKKYEFFLLVFPFCKNPDEHPVFAVCFSKQWQDTLLVSLHNFLATIFQCMPQPTLARIETEAIQMKKLQEENIMLRNRLQSSQQTPTSSSSMAGSSTHQSRHSTFHDERRSHNDDKQRIQINSNPQSLNDVMPFAIQAPADIVDDFFIIAQEKLNVSNMADSQARSLRSIIRNISSGGSPVMGRKDSVDRGKKRSGSVGSRTWNLN